METGTTLQVAPAPSITDIVRGALLAADVGKQRQPWVAVEFLLERMSPDEISMRAQALQSFWSVIATDLGYGRVFRDEESYAEFVGSLCAMLGHPAYVRATGRFRRVRFGGPSRPAVTLEARTAAVVGLLGKLASPKHMMVKVVAA